VTAAARLVSELRRRGLALRRDGDNLVVRPKSSMTPDLRAQLLAHKAEVLALLGTSAEGGTPRSGAPSLGPVHLAALTTGGCYACGSVVFWKLREADELVCAVCHPPGPPPEHIEWRRGRSHG
jgi:hypothetical protein